MLPPPTRSSYDDGDDDFDEDGLLVGFPASRGENGSDDDIDGAPRSYSKSRTTDLQWKPWFNSDLKNAQTIHNINLILMSAIMLYGVIIESWRRMNNDYDNDNSNWSLSFLICEEESGPAKGALYYWSYMYYLSKYYELLDTVLQLARGKPPPNFILHVYHHAIVLIMVSN